jgi:signal transduction histidine kinase
MSPPIQVRNHPLRFLLYLEWLLLALTVLSELPVLPRYHGLRWRELNLICLLAFAGMGLRLPTGKLWQKGLYTIGALGLILISSFGGGLRLFSPLYVVFVIRNCLIFEQPLRSILTLVAFGSAFLTQIYRFQSFDRLPRFPPILPRFIATERSEALLISFGFLLGLVLLFLQLLVNAVLAERKSREQLAIANTQLRQYALRIEDVATLQERNRIAREIHDSLGHSLTVFNLHLEAVLRLWESDPAEAKALVREAKQVGATTLQEVRQSVSALRSDPLQGKTLEAAILNLGEDFKRSTGIEPKMQIHPANRLPTQFSTPLYRIIQEALTNICKYAHATEVTIHLELTDELTLIIQDNGSGFDPSQTTTGFGLQGMRERTLALGGTFEVVTAPRQGCRIVAKFRP